MNDNPESDEIVCYNCKYMMWLVGLGQGLKCSDIRNYKDNKFFNIPSRRHTCGYFLMNKPEEKE